MSQFNRAQLATWQEARDLAAMLSRTGEAVGAGVMPETKDPLTSGIYIPSWLAGPSNFPRPGEVDPETKREYLWLHLRFRNRAEGVCVGLVLDRLRRYPSAPGYVLQQLAVEVEGLAREWRPEE